MDKDKFPDLTTPPIVEAVVEFRFEPNEATSLEQLEAFANQLEDTYKNKTPIFEQVVKLALNIGAESSATSKATPSGFRLENIEKNRIIICAVDRLVISMKTPYVSWPALANLAMTNYTAYIGHLPGQRFTRLGLRYINQLQLTMDEDAHFEDYLSTMPRIPKIEGIPQSLHHFETAVHLYFDDISCQSTVRQNIRLPDDKIPANADDILLTLDIDVFQHIQEEMDEKAINSLLDNMRDKKNRLFFGSLTDKALKPYL